MVTAYTAADDSRLQQLQRFAEFYRAFNPHGVIKLIPFSENIKAVRKECEKWGIDVVNPSPIIDECGQTIFKDKEYRPGVMAWRYMRKLNCFIDSTTNFVFTDINNVPLYNLDIFSKIITRSRKDILFSGMSAPKRTIRAKNRHIYDLLSKNIGPGYNCSLIASKPNIIVERDFEFLSNPKLIKLFAKAPEQGYLALMMTLSSISHDILRSYVKKMNLVVGRSTTLKPQQLRIKSNTIYNTKGGILVSYKTTGEQLSDLPSEITEAVQEQAKQWLRRKA